MECEVPFSIQNPLKIATIQRIFNLLWGVNPLGELGKSPIFAILQSSWRIGTPQSGLVNRLSLA